MFSRCGFRRARSPRPRLWKCPWSRRRRTPRDRRRSERRKRNSSFRTATAAGGARTGPQMVTRRLQGHRTTSSTSPRGRAVARPSQSLALSSPRAGHRSGAVVRASAPSWRLWGPRERLRDRWPSAAPGDDALTWLERSCGATAEAARHRTRPGHRLLGPSRSSPLPRPAARRSRFEDRSLHDRLHSAAAMAARRRHLGLVSL